MMRCRLCDRRMRPGQRVTVASIVERSGELSPVMALHESCMGEVVRDAGAAVGASRRRGRNGAGGVVMGKRHKARKVRPGGLPRTAGAGEAMAPAMRTRPGFRGGVGSVLRSWACPDGRFRLRFARLSKSV